MGRRKFVRFRVEQSGHLAKLRENRSGRSRHEHLKLIATSPCAHVDFEPSRSFLVWNNRQAFPGAVCI